MKKIVLLTSSGGGGTLSASIALEEYLKKNYSVTSVHVFDEVLKPVDFCNAITFGRYSCEDIYNFFIPRKQFKMLTLLYHIGRWYIHIKRTSIRRILREYFIKNKPNLIISVVPILNNILLSIAQELNIPFLLIPTDLDVHMYISNIKSTTYNQFHIGIPFKDLQLTAPIKQAKIPETCISTIGSPLRPDFFQQKNIPVLKQEFNIPENKPVIMILMGAQGSHDIEHYIQQLSTITLPLHLIICNGKNGKKISHNRIPKHITQSTIEFTSRIADLMAISDIIITKSGSLSVCEAIYMNTPMILDATSTVLPWERLNHELIKTHQFGTSLKRYTDIVPLITELVSNPEKLALYKNNLQVFSKENIEIELNKYIQKILQ